MRPFPRGSHRLLLAFIAGIYIFFSVSVAAFCQTVSLSVPPAMLRQRTGTSAIPMSVFQVSSLAPGSFGEDAGGSGAGQSSDHHAIVKHSVKRVLEDQKELYIAPFNPSNLKWDAVVLGGTAVFLSMDHHIENRLPGTHYNLYSDMSNAGIAGMGAALAGLWAYGIKNHNPHAQETGALELETLVNTFLIYTPMQLISGRQRPFEGNGHGDFWRHHGLNTSFPSGHALFTFSMATVVADEYPKRWVQVLAYSAAAAVTTGRLLARDHWSSDIWVGSALGVGIGTHIFHAHCEEGVSPSCQHHRRRFPLVFAP